MLDGGNVYWMLALYFHFGAFGSDVPNTGVCVNGLMISPLCRAYM